MTVPIRLKIRRSGIAPLADVRNTCDALGEWLGNEGMGKSLIKDTDWTIIDGQACRVARFTPLAKLEQGKVNCQDRTMPYALISLECPDLSPDAVGAIVHKVDFRNLWAAFIERKVKRDEEVIVFWIKTNLRGFAKLFSRFMPGLCVMICKAGAYELMTDRDYRPELDGEARFLAERPLVEWRPNVYR